MLGVRVLEFLIFRVVEVSSVRVLKLSSCRVSEISFVPNAKRAKNIREWGAVVTAHLLLPSM